MADRQRYFSWVACCPTAWTNDLRKALVLRTRADSQNCVTPPFAVRELNMAKVAITPIDMTVN